ncbi:tyrosine-type recombinase/integrase [Ramlibacter aquaticus]|uniref:Tyrosine-type recombinase/integrase n=2 Tax=Comamonadaceae TaxID=80864 RepID=A0ABR9SH60_9BURK|nr:tyrosine-type recombinase/integrase [Ramlibacter aquaticus]
MKPVMKRLNDGGGLHIRQSGTGRKYWYQDYTFQGRRNSLSLGEYPVVGLREAREKSLALKRQIEAGANPSMSARSATQAEAPAQGGTTVRANAEAWMAVHESTWSESHKKKVACILQLHLFPMLGDRAIRSVAPREITMLVDAVARTGRLETARRLLGYCQRIFGHAESHGRVRENFIIKAVEVLPSHTVRHRAALTDPAALQGFLLKADAYPGSFITRCALSMHLLTLLRSAELRGARWSEFDFHNARWLVPSERMKGPKKRKVGEPPHIVPLSTQAIEVLRQLREVTGANEYVFPGQGRRPTISDGTVNKAIRQLGYCTKTQQSAHGFRATARTMVVERLGWSDNVIELQLDHEVKDANGRAYNRTRLLMERAAMMQDWADYLDWLRQTSSTNAQRFRGHNTTTSLHTTPIGFATPMEAFQAGLIAGITAAKGSPSLSANPEAS